MRVCVYNYEDQRTTLRSQLQESKSSHSGLFNKRAMRSRCQPHPAGIILHNNFEEELSLPALLTLSLFCGGFETLNVTSPALLSNPVLRVYLADGVLLVNFLVTSRCHLPNETLLFSLWDPVQATCPLGFFLLWCPLQPSPVSHNVIKS